MQRKDERPQCCNSIVVHLQTLFAHPTPWLAGEIFKSAGQASDHDVAKHGQITLDGSKRPAPQSKGP